MNIREREKSVGPFSLDILAHDTLRDCPVIIENQLEQTDHDHLGKLITYGSVLEAGALIWIARTFRDEHRYAIGRPSNPATDRRADFFAVALEAVEIDEFKSQRLDLARSSPSPDRFGRSHLQAIGVIP